MNTNILTILNNIVSQKTGGRIAALDKTNPADGRQTIEESTFPAKTTDNNTDKSNRKSNNENSKFNDTLREKMHAETPEQTDNAKNKNEKSVKKQALNAYNIPFPVKDKGKI